MKKQLKNIIGNILITLQPRKARELEIKGITQPIKMTLKERLMRVAILRKVENKKDFDTLAEFHRNYWAEKGEVYFSNLDNILESFFKPKCAFMIDLLQEELKNEADDFHTLIEIGTGKGDVLEYLSLRLPEINRFVGIDLSTAQTERNRIFYKNNKLEFVASDGFDWVKKNGSSNMIIITSGGVLEYFTQSRLQFFLKELNDMGKIIFIAIEPTYVNHDFLEEPNSFAFGFESSFSHNYKLLFENAGFELWHQSKIRYSDELNFNFIGVKN